MHSEILGINARNIDLVMGENRREMFKYADDKLLSKDLFIKHGIPTPKLYATVESQLFVEDFFNDIKKYESSVIKPASGFGGSGIIVVNSIDGDNFHCAGNRVLTIDELTEHTVNIMYGAFSMDNKFDVAFAEEKIVFDESLSFFAEHGLPDIRVIVYRGKPVAAMLRTATKISMGKANLHAGGMAVGIDIETGKTKHGWFEKKHISKHPDVDKTIVDIEIPYWKRILEISSDIYSFIDLGYMGVDITLDRNLGPMVIEINARPGLEIQNVLAHGLKRVLE